MVEAQEILNTLLDAVICFTPERKVVASNEAANKLCPGLKQLAEGKPGATSPPLEQVLAQLRLPPPGSGPVYRYLEMEIDGTFTWLQALVTRHDSPAASYVVLVVPDPRFHGRLSRRLQACRKRLALGALAGGLEHEFNNALTTVISALDLALASANLTRDLQDGLRHAKSSAQRAADLIQSLSTLTGQPRSAPEPIEVRPILDRVVTILRRCLDPRVRIEAPVTTDHLWFVQAHSGDLMEMVIQSALSAQEGMEEGGAMSLTAENQVTTSPAEKAGQFVRLTLTATVHGSTPPETNRDTSWVREPDADWIYSVPTLPQLLKEMNGWMEVEKQGPDSAALHFFLPRCEAILPPPPVARPITRTGKVEGNERIMLVDDEELVRMVIKAILSHRGYKVTEAEDGEAAVEKYLQTPEAFDLVLIDMNMPRLSGRDALLQMRQHHPTLRAIMLSGGVEDPDGTGTTGLEGVVFLRKPFDNQELLRTVRKCLDTPAGKS